MSFIEDLPAVHHVSAGISALTVGGRPACVPLEVLRADALRLTTSVFDAYAYAPGGDETLTLGVLTDTLLVRDEALDWVGQEVLVDVGGARRFADPETALFDVQWRLNIMGRQVAVIDGPASPDVPATAEARLLRRRGLLTTLDTNLSDEFRGVLAPVAQILGLSSSLHASRTDTTALDLQRSPGGDEVGDLSVPTSGLLGAYAIDGALDNLTETDGVRDYVQRVRRVPDRALAPLIGPALPTVLGLDPSADAPGFDRLATILGVDRVLWEPMHVLVVAPEDGAARRRADALIESLGRDVVVRRVDPQTDTMTEEGRELPGIAADHTEWADVIVLIGVVLADAPGTAYTSTPLVADLSTMDVLGWLMNARRTDSRAVALVELVKRADRVLVADDVQRDLVLGTLAGTGRVNDVVYDADPSLTSLVAADPDGVRLEAFCRRPIRAADAGSLSAAEAVALTPRSGDLAIAVQYLREGGVRKVAEKASGRVRRVVAERKGN